MLCVGTHSLLPTARCSASEPLSFAIVSIFVLRYSNFSIFVLRYSNFLLSILVPMLCVGTMLCLGTAGSAAFPAERRENGVPAQRANEQAQSAYRRASPRRAQGREGSSYTHSISSKCSTFLNSGSPVTTMALCCKAEATTKQSA